MHRLLYSAHMNDGALLDAARRLINNPYEADPVLWEQQRTELAGCELAPTIRRWVRADRIEEAEGLLLAHGLSRACEAPEDTPQVFSMVPARVFTPLPKSRGAYLRVVCAAARCRQALQRIQGVSPQMHDVRRQTWASCFGSSLRHLLYLEPVVRDQDVLILGETGTGKEAVAAAIRAGTLGGPDGSVAPSSAVNAAAIPETLIGSELFGHVKGAFTGATEDRPGRLRAAHGGCFFLDEVGDLLPTTQVKLLRVMETNVVSPLGADHGLSVDVRYVAATHKDLGKMVDAGEYRRDLYQRLAGLVIQLPPLRERPEDIVAIGEAFMRRHVPEGRFPKLEASITEWLYETSRRHRPWVGNVRELQNLLRNALLGLDEQDALVRPSLVPTRNTGVLPGLEDARLRLRDVEDWYIQHVLRRAGGNYAEAARVLGIDRSTVKRRAREA